MPDTYRGRYRCGEGVSGHEPGARYADEVQVGFGRVGDAFRGFELQGVVPDIVTLGAALLVETLDAILGESALVGSLAR